MIKHPEKKKIESDDTIRLTRQKDWPATAGWDG